MGPQRVDVLDPVSGGRWCIVRVSRSAGLALGLLVLLAAGAAGVVVSRVTMLDLAVYRAGATAILEGTPLYTARPPGSLLLFTYPPFAALAFVPLAWLAQAPAQLLFTVASVLALVRVCVLVVGASGRGTTSARPVTLLVAVVGLALCAEPVAQTLAFGQVNLVLMWLVVEDVLGLGARAARTQGLLVGLAAGLKLVPASFVLLFAVVGRWRAAAVAGSVFLATVAVGALARPADARAYWTVLLFDSPRVGDPQSVGNQSLFGLLSRTWSGSEPLALWLALAVATLALCAGLARWYWRRGLRLAALALVASAGLLCSPISWSHHWVWLVVMVGACLELSYLRAVRIVGVLAAVAPLTWIVWWAGRLQLESVPGPLRFLAVNAYVLVAVAFVAVLWWVRRDVVSIGEGEQGSAAGRHSRAWPDRRAAAVDVR